MINQLNIDMDENLNVDFHIESSPLFSVAALPSPKCLLFNSKSTWILKIDPDGRIDMNPEVEQSEAAASFIEIVRNMFSSTQVTYNSFQGRIAPWMLECFGPAISADRMERGDRFLEEALELLQSGGYPADRIPTITSYVYGRPPGDAAQEVGGVMVTLAAYCLAHGLDMHAAGEAELARIWTKVEQIRAKQASKRGLHSPLPIAPWKPEDAWYHSRGSNDDAPWTRCASREDAIAAGLLEILPGESFQIALGSPHAPWSDLFSNPSDLMDHIDATNEDNAFEEGFCEEAGLSEQDLKPLTGQINALWHAFATGRKLTGNLLQLRDYETITKPAIAAGS